MFKFWEFIEDCEKERIFTIIIKINIFSSTTCIILAREEVTFGEYSLPRYDMVVHFRNSIMSTRYLAVAKVEVFAYSHIFEIIKSRVSS